MLVCLRGLESIAPSSATEGAEQRPCSLSGVWQPVMGSKRRGEEGLTEEGSGNKDHRRTIKEGKKALRV